MNNFSKIIWLINDSFRNLSGHHFNYNKSLYEYAIANNFECNIIGNKELLNFQNITDILPITPLFRYADRDCFSLKYINIRKINVLYSIIRHNWEFYIDLKFGLSNKLQKNDILFAPNVNANKQLLGWALWLNSLPSKISIKLVLMFLSEPNKYITKFNFKILELLGRRHIIIIATDSERMAIKYNKLTKLPVDVYPIPLNCSLNKKIEKFQGKKLRFVSLGEAREDKGFKLLVNAIENLNEEKKIQDIEFILQCNTDHKNYYGKLDIDRIIERLKYNDNVKFISEPLQSDDYYRLMESADFILLPYKQKVYHARTSGILVEAIVAGKPVIVTNDTWMSDQLQKFGSGITFQDGNVEDLVKAILIAKVNYKELTEQAYVRRSTYIEYHNPKTLFELLLKC